MQLFYILIHHIAAQLHGQIGVCTVAGIGQRAVYVHGAVSLRTGYLFTVDFTRTGAFKSAAAYVINIFKSRCSSDKLKC